MVALSKAQNIHYGVFMWHHGLTLLKDALSRKEVNHLEHLHVEVPAPEQQYNLEEGGFKWAKKGPAKKRLILPLHGVGQSDRHRFCHYIVFFGQRFKSMGNDGARIDA